MAKQLNRKAIAAHDPTTSKRSADDSELPKSDPFTRFDQAKSDAPPETDIDIDIAPSSKVSEIRRGRTTNEPLSKTVLVAFRPHEHELVQRKAAEEGISVRQYMRRAILRDIEK